MGFLAKLFGHKTEEQTEETVADVADTVSDTAAQAGTKVEEAAAAAAHTGTHMATEAEEQIGYAAADAKEAMHDVAQDTPAEEVSEDALKHHNQ